MSWTVIENYSENKTEELKSLDDIKNQNETIKNELKELRDQFNQLKNETNDMKETKELRKGMVELCKSMIDLKNEIVLLKKSNDDSHKLFMSKIAQLELNRNHENFQNNPQNPQNPHKQNEDHPELTSPLFPSLYMNPFMSLRNRNWAIRNNLASKFIPEHTCDCDKKIASK